MNRNAMERPAAKSRRGFTLLEVMMAMAVITIGAGALIGMQTMTARANAQARNVTIATDIAQTWAERLKLDALSWTQLNGFGNTIWLGNSTANMGTWITPGTAAGVPLRSYAFDRFGRDIAPGATGLFFCVAYQYAWVAPPNVADPDEPPAMRVDIRVFWPREGTGAVATCTPPADQTNYYIVGLPIVVRRSALVQP